MGKRWAESIRLIGIGWYVALCILLGTLGGRWLGQRLDGKYSELAFTLIGLFIGLAVAFYGMYRMIKSVVSDDDNKTGE